MKLVVDGLDYPFPDSLTFGEARVFKQVGGIRPNELGEAALAGDPDVIAAMLIVAMRRAGRPVTIEDIDRMPITSVEIHAEETDLAPAEEVGPQVPPVNAPPTGGADKPSDDEKPSSETILVSSGVPS